MSRRLIIEVDGEHHAQTGEYDLAREKVLREKGFEVLRFSAIEVTKDRASVVDQFLQALGG
jgi:very-short-patch-repair endonuclease